MQTQPLISLHRRADPISYETAVDLAAAANGFLLTFSISDSDQQEIGDAVDQRFYEDPFWSADSPHPIEETVNQYAVEYNNTSVVRGTAYADHYFGTVGANQTVYAGAGDDTYYSSGGGKIYLGSGNDRLALQGTGPDVDYLHEQYAIATTIIYDGPGNDIIEGGVVRAAIDGDTDTFYSLTRLSYADATSDVTLDYQTDGDGQGAVYIDGYGSDLVYYLPEIVGGMGDDWLSGVALIRGGRGEDYIAPTVRGEGGDGDDTLIADASSKITLLGEAGADTFIFRSYAEATGGAGADTYIFEAGSRAKINDLRAGDLVDLSVLLDVTISGAFAEGYLKTNIANGYTYLSYDADGAGDAWTDLATFKGVYSNLGDYLIA